MKDFLLRKFEIEYNTLQALIRCIEAQEDLVPEYAIKGVCHIINVHHIWNCRLQHIRPESNEWDIFPLQYLEKLNTQNFQETFDCLEKKELDSIIEQQSEQPETVEISAVDILFHLLQHSSYHRGQIVLNLKSNGLNYPGNGLVQLVD
jgi:uncharacterized damage-inducible protein DinB